jgi:hypothetical protein
MTRSAALSTRWLAHRSRGCPLDFPVPVTYRLSGAKAPPGVRGTAEFRRGRLRTLSLTRGVRTATGVTVGRTAATRMVARYHRAGFGVSARFLPTFGGTFVTVRRHGRQVLGGFAKHRTVTILAVPAVPVCE